MKKIHLSQYSKRLTVKRFAVVDDEYYEMINKFKWCYKKGRNNSTGYAARGINQKRFGGGTEDVKMHRVILGLKRGDGKRVDHKDGDGLNNQKHNLRIATNQQNSRNRRSYGSSKYLGVSLIRRKRGKNNGYTYYSANINVNGVRKWLGAFPPTPEGEILAALVYNDAAFQLDPEFAKLNII